MLEFIVGRGGTGKTWCVLERIGDTMSREPLGSALILLLPEHMTYEAERALAAKTKGEGFLRAFVFGFRRFARQVLLETGGAAHPRLSDVGRRLLIRRILAARQDELTFFARSAGERGFTGTLAEAFKEIKSYRLDGDKLQKAAEQVTDNRLKNKLRDIALLADDFAKETGGVVSEAEDWLNLLTQRLPQGEIIKGAEVFIDGFIFFNPQERAIIAAMLKAGADVHITLAMDAEVNSRENRQEVGLFRRSYETMRTLRALAGELGIETKITRLAENHRFLRPALLAIEQQLFRLPPKPTEDAAGVKLIAAANRRLEVLAVAADMVRLCREEGYRWRDMGVLVRAEDIYNDLLELALEDSGIPFFRAGKRPGGHHPLAELIRSAFEVLRGWRYEAVFRCLSTGFFPLEREKIDLLENYVLAHGIRGRSRWLMEDDWTWWRRLSLEEEAPGEEARAELEAINAMRRLIAAPLADFATAVASAGDVRTLSTALYDFLLSLDVPKRLREWSDKAEEAGRLAAAAEHRQIWDGVVTLLEQAVEIGGGDKMTVPDFAATIGEGLDALEISLIPPGLDYVNIAPFDQNSLANSRAIYILGANEGVMPRRRHEKGIFSDADRLHLRDIGVELASGGLEGHLAEKYLLYRGFTMAREYLWVSYSLAGSEGDGQNPSSLITSLREILPTAKVTFIPLESLGRDDELLLSVGSRAVTGLAPALRGLKERGAMPPFWQDVYNWTLKQPKLRDALTMARAGLFAKAGEGELPAEIARKLYTRRGNLRGSVTRFESFRACPFRHFAAYGLKLAEREEYRFQAPDLGTLLHGILREFGEELKKQSRRWSDVGEEEGQAMCAELVERLAPRLRSDILLSSAQYRHLTERIKEAAWHSLRRLIALDVVSKFHPAMLEKSFGRAGEPGLSCPLSKGATLTVTGQIDRLDRDETGRYFLIIDYKTGQAAINLIEVYYGLRLQLLTYLLVAKNTLTEAGEDALPAGMLYFFLKYPVLTATRKITAEEAEEELAKKLRMPGWVLADPEVVQAIDSSLSFIKVQLKRDGDFYSSSWQNSIKTAEEFAILLDYVGWLLTDTAEEILGGNIAAQPYRLGNRDACAYCPYRAVCGFDDLLPGYDWRELGLRGKEEIMDTMELLAKGELTDEVVNGTKTGD